MKTTLKNNLSNFSLVFLLTLISFNSCSKDEIISTPQKQGQIKVEIKESIDDIDLKNQVEKNLSKIKQLFEIAPPKSMRKFNGKSTRNDTILEHIQVNTEAYNSIENRNGKVSYTFQVDFPSDSTNVSEIINLHTYYDENNQLKSQLIKYELTNEEFLVATNNQSFDGLWDKISYLDLETTEIVSNSKNNTSARSGDPCPCEGGGSTTTVIWVPYPNNSGYGGSSVSGVGYALPPLNTFPPNVMAALQAAGVFVGINYNNYAPYGYGHNYTTPVLNFSTNDLAIPAYNPSSPATPFNNYYAYYFSGIKNIIKDYYEKVYVSQINSYVTSSLTTLEDHIVKQKAVYDFFKFTYELYAQNRTQFYYLSSNHKLTKSIFNFLAENNTGSFYQYNQAKTFAKAAIGAMINGGEVDFDDEIINELTGKALCAYNKLLSSGVSNFHNMITDLFIEFGDSNIGGRDLTFKMSSDLPNNFGGKTQVDSNGNYHILINENLMNTLSSIEVAAILVHEMAHAFLGKHYIDYNSSFTELYEKYINDTGIQNYSHDIMKDQFINRMATAIKNYDSSIFSNFEDYKILASQGVFELTNDQKEDLLTVKLLSRNNDKNCD